MTKKPLTVEELQEYFYERDKKEKKSKPYTLDELYEDYSVWYYLPDREYFDAILSCSLDRQVDPDILLWMYVIANSGNFKSEFTRALSKLGDIFKLDKLTENTLISGKVVKKKGKSVPVIGLLPEIDGKILLIKDFTTILTMHADRRKEIFGQFRTIYDGEVKYGYGNFDKRIEVKAKIGALIFTTPIIDKYRNLESQLGSRFLSIRHKPFNEEDAEIRREKMKENCEKMDRIRSQIAWLTQYFIGELKFDYALEFSDEWQNRVYDLANYVAYMRAQVDMAYKWSHPTDTIGEVQREETTRVFQQLLKLGKCLCYLRQKQEFEKTEFNTLIRVAEDSISPHIRSRVLKLYLRDSFQPKDGRYRELGISRKYYSDVLKVMEGCQILDETHELTPKAKELMLKVYLPDEYEAMKNQPLQPKIVKVIKMMPKEGRHFVL